MVKDSRRHQPEWGAWQFQGQRDGGRRSREWRRCCRLWSGSSAQTPSSSPPSHSAHPCPLLRPCLPFSLFQLDPEVGEGDEGKYTARLPSLTFLWETAFTPFLPYSILAAKLIGRSQNRRQTHHMQLCDYFSCFCFFQFSKIKKVRLILVL